MNKDKSTYYPFNGKREMAEQEIEDLYKDPRVLDINKPQKSKFNDLIVEWIQANLIPIKSSYNLVSSYFLKHRFSEWASSNVEGVGDAYINNGEFKYAMKCAGFKPYYDDGINAHYALSKKSPALKR